MKNSLKMHKSNNDNVKYLPINNLGCQKWRYCHFGALVCSTLVIFWHYCKNIILALLFRRSGLARMDYNKY